MKNATKQLKEYLKKKEKETPAIRGKKNYYTRIKVKLDNHT
jgi:ribosomal protein S30